MVNLFYILLAVALVLLNAFFVAAEFAMVKLRHTQIQAIKESYGLRGRILDEVHQHLDAYLSACQLGITLASLGLGWIGEPAFAYLFQPVFELFHINSPQLIEVMSFFMAFLLITFLHIVIGELMPKTLAIRKAETISIWTAIPLYGFYWLMYPAIWCLNSCAAFMLKMTGLNVAQNESFYSTNEIKHIVSASHLHGELNRDETEILGRTLEFAELKVTEVMRPRDDLIMLDIKQPIETLVKIILEYRYSRYPVYEGNYKKIIGIIHTKDFFPALCSENVVTDLHPFIRPILKIHHDLPAIDLLRKFREGMSPFALVYKGKETLLGFVTLDNLLHVLIGRIRDEFHKTQDDWLKNADGSLSVKGECSIYSLERALDHDITLNEDEENIDTLSGLIVAHAGTLPKIGEKVEFKEFDAIIEELHGSRIRKIRIYPKLNDKVL